MTRLTHDINDNSRSLQNGLPCGILRDLGWPVRVWRTNLLRERCSELAEVPKECLNNLSDDVRVHSETVNAQPARVAAHHQ